MSLPRILVDLERVKHPNCGLGRFSLYLGREIARRSGIRWHAVMLLPAEPSRHPLAREAAVLPARWWRRIRAFSRPGFDLWHVTWQGSRFPPPRGTPYLLTVHDLNFLDAKSEAKAARRLRSLQRRVDGASALTFVSEATQRLAQQHLSLPDVPRRVIHNGIEVEPESAAPPLRPDFAPPRPFLFALGVVRAKKNLHTLVDLLPELPELDLVIAGHADHPYAAELRERARQQGVGDRLTLPGEVSDPERDWLYRHCSAFLFPSLQEGFGLPLAEAMAFGRPIVSSTAPSLVEVGGPDVVYWSDFAPGPMAERVRHALELFRAEPERAERLRQRARRFSWSAAADGYVELYEELLAAHSGR